MLYLKNLNILQCYSSFCWLKRSTGVVPKQKSEKHQDWEIPEALPPCPGRQRGGSDPVWTRDLCLSHLGQHVQAGADPQRRGRPADVPRLDPDLQQLGVLPAVLLGPASAAPPGVLQAFRVAPLGGRPAAAAAPWAPADQSLPWSWSCASPSGAAAPPLVLQPPLPELQELQSSSRASPGRLRCRRRRWGPRLCGPGGPLAPSAHVLGGHSRSRTPPPPPGGPADLHGLHLRPDLQRRHRHKLPGVLSSWEQGNVLYVFMILIRSSDLCKCCFCPDIKLSYLIWCVQSIIFQRDQRSRALLLQIST